MEEGGGNKENSGMKAPGLKKGMRKTFDSPLLVKKTVIAPEKLKALKEKMKAMEEERLA